MKRQVHFVGSLPEPLMSSPRAAMGWILDHRGGQPLTALPCDIDPNWIIDYLRDLHTRTDVLDFDVTTDDYADYNHMPTGRIRSGVTLTPDDIAMRRVDTIDRIVNHYTALRRDRPELANVKLQLSQPNSLDMSLFALAGSATGDGLPIGQALSHLGALATALRHVPVFTQAIFQEITTLTRKHGSLITWQVESPVALLSLVKATELHAAPLLAAMVARQLAAVFTGLHRLGAASSLHLCYGDYRHTALLQPRSLGPAVALLNPLARQLRRDGTPLPKVHIPCAYGAEPAPLDPRFYTPLRRLDPGWTLIAGVVCPASVVDSMISLRLFERAANWSAHAVATACGLGRCAIAGAEQAADATAATAAFSDHWLPAAARDDHNRTDTGPTKAKRG
ncbi:hypothetical protein ACFYV7_15010 [Nocardia suismassiliense]|uniref:Uncharacterized protein n=1 Tax=Nocardia suismassiliense TaxID=2077092 RepID=A0ABW6QS93_9NOCA